MGKKKLAFVEQIEEAQQEAVEIIAQTAPITTNIQPMLVAQTVSPGFPVAMTSQGIVPYLTSHMDHRGQLCGMALESGNPGDTVRVKTVGRVYLPEWGLTQGIQYWASPLGSIQPWPMDGGTFTQILGIALSPNEFLLEPKAPIKLAS
ncbi:hypothetical protein Q5H92_14850 [Hymenobacter sp. M29]|uniref:Uncharacterized protein n=1 Tax=Hymenobacter mellowenesis TaxID=3063995 RepID=A0ABT9ACT4_9BACT|nr:hypothetical protein [Hymenobacter sp. M29]MDO7847645.1 hypothetical protein [Hymenobacter sp. M29]